MMNEIFNVKTAGAASNVNWEPWVLLVAILALIASIVIPFAQKKYEEYRIKRNFQYYLKKQIGLVLNQLTNVKLDYIEPSVKNDPSKKYLFIKDFIIELRKAYNEHKNSVQPRVIFMLLMNVEKLCQFASSLNDNISAINLQLITEKTLEHGKELSKDELNKIYGLILIYESYISISRFHDKFDGIKSIKRVYENGRWVGLSVENELLSNQNRLSEDLLFLNDNETSLEELQNVILVVNQETRKYFDYERSQMKRKKVC